MAGVILTAAVAHPRKIIRHAIVAALLGATAAGDRVQATRLEPYRKSQLPAIGVYTPDEPIDVETSEGSSPRQLRRALTVRIAAAVEAPTGALDDVADPMDDIAEQIEAVMAADPYFGPRGSELASDSILINTEMGVRGGEGGERIYGIITLTYVVTYWTSSAAVGTDDFLRVHAVTQMPGVEDADAMVNDINVRPT